LEIENRALILDLVEWVGAKPRPYAEALEVWRTSCPRLPIWEDAQRLGLVACDRLDGVMIATLTPAGRTLLSAERPGVAITE
jgi:hypothetical protein